AGDLVRSDELHRNQTYCPLQVYVPEVAAAMRKSIEQTGQQKLFVATVAADDPADMVARGRYVLEQFGPLAANCGFQVGGPLASLGALTVLRRAFPAQFLHYHCAGAASVASGRSLRLYSAFVHAKLARILGASGALVETSWELRAPGTRKAPGLRKVAVGDEPELHEDGDDEDAGEEDAAAADGAATYATEGPDTAMATSSTTASTTSTLARLTASQSTATQIRRSTTGALASEADADLAWHVEAAASIGVGWSDSSFSRI
ncbi:unnamed protein product, partial [Polarella glacialis]